MTPMLPDIQDEIDDRGVELDEVGISGLRYPVVLVDGRSRIEGVALAEMTVRLPEDRRGTHMSRMVEMVESHFREFDPRTSGTAMKAIASRLDADEASVTIEMPFSTRVVSPVSASASWQVHDLAFTASIRSGNIRTATKVSTDVTSVCPCSKAISDYGAHNQRSRVSVSASGSDDDPYPLTISDAVALIRSVGSAPVFPLVKRPDERQLTMAAHDKPAFVEDMARDLALALRARGVTFTVDVRNIESIHSHDAVARVSS